MCAGRFNWKASGKVKLGTKLDYSWRSGSCSRFEEGFSEFICMMREGARVVDLEVGRASAAKYIHHSDGTAGHGQDERLPPVAAGNE